MRVRRLTGGSSLAPPFFRTIAGRRLLRQAGIVVGAFVVGYLLTVFWLFPAPLFKTNHRIPRVLDLGVTAARQKLDAQGFRFRIADQRPDPSLPRNAVVWQDPPPGVAAPPNTQVSLILSDGPPDVPVPDISGFPRPLAEKVLAAAGFKVGRVDTLPAASEPGVVVQTRPGAGAGRSAGSPIDLVLSSGPVEITVPGVVGLPLADARQLISSAGLVLGTTASRVTVDRPEGLVLDQRPAPGTRTARGARVDVILSRRAGP